MIPGADLKLMADDVARAYRRAGFRVRTAAYDLSFGDADVTGGPTGVDAGPDVIVQADTEPDAFFVWLASSISIRDEADPPNGEESWLEAAVLQIRDERSGWRLAGPDRVLPHQIIAGQQGAPAILGFPYIFPPGSTVTVLFGNHRDTHLRLTLHGIKLFTEPYTERLILPDVPGLEAA